MAGIVASSSLASKIENQVDDEDIDNWAKDQLERDQHFMMAGHSSHASHGSHGSHGSHRSSSGGITVPRSGSNSTTPSNPLPVPKKPSTTQKVSQIQLMKVQAYLTGMNLYRGNIDGIDGPLTREAIIKYQKRYGLSRTGIVNSSLLRHMGLD